jgi:chromate reductase
MSRRLVGSLCRDSYTRRLVCALADLAKPSMLIDIVAIGELPFYKQDNEPEPPAAWVAFHGAAQARRRGVVRDPEKYNRPVPAGLKNALDVGSRPLVRNVFAGKPTAVICNSPGTLGGFGANQHVRQSLVALNMVIMPQPEAYISKERQAV